MKFKEGDYAKVPSLKWLPDRNMEVKDKKKPIYVRIQYGYTDMRGLMRYYVHTLKDIPYGQYREDQLTPATDEEIMLWKLSN